jgi:DNA repair exonuclease SbcCD ATPase subunit
MTDKIEELQTVIKGYKRHLGAVEETRQAVQDLTKNWMAFKELKKAEVIVESKKRYQAKFDAVDSKLTMHLLAVNAFKTIEECIATSQTEERVYATLANALSPKSGLIAENIVGFINDFIASMNRVIAEVWAHPLELIPLSFEDGEEVDLDYKFPFVVGEARSRRDDLCQGSLGMEYIFDIAFKLTAMQSLGLKGYPIFLDEFGGNLDDAHKEASVHMIDTIMSSYDISQMFMVSHNVSSYGAFVNSETFVLCNKNLKVQ